MVSFMHNGSDITTWGVASITKSQNTKQHF